MPMHAATGYLQVDESSDGGGVRLTLRGELDLASAPILAERLRQLRDEGAPVRLDLSRLEFTDSTGLQAIIRAVADARSAGWQLQVEPRVSPQVTRLLKLTNLDRYIVGEALPGR